MTTTPRPFRILGVQQIAIGAPSKAPLRHLWVDLFGLPVTGTYRSEPENVDEDICAMGRGAHRVEVAHIEPLGAVAFGGAVAGVRDVTAAVKAATTAPAPAPAAAARAAVAARAAIAARAAHARARAARQRARSGRH